MPPLPLPRWLRLDDIEGAVRLDGPPADPAAIVADMKAGGYVRVETPPAPEALGYRDTALPTLVLDFAPPLRRRPALSLGPQVRFPPRVRIWRIDERTMGYRIAGLSRWASLVVMIGLLVVALVSGALTLGTSPDSRSVHEALFMAFLFSLGAIVISNFARSDAEKLVRRALGDRVPDDPIPYSSWLSRPEPAPEAPKVRVAVDAPQPRVDAGVDDEDGEPTTSRRQQR
jgi:hypothetical protein